MNENQAKENQAKENQAFEKKIGSDGRYYMPYNWRKFFKPEILKQAETSHYTVSSISRGTYHLSGVVKISPKQSVEVFIHNMPHDITECNSSIGGYCQLWSCSNNCVHMAALLLAYEKQCGPFILKESDYAFRSRKEMEAKAAERKRREALAESLKGQTMTALDAIGGPLKSDGLIFYDLNRILRNCTVTAYSAKRYEEVCKDSEPDVKLEETVLRTGVKQLRCSMNTSDTLGYVSTQMIFESDRIYLYECTCSNHNGLCEHQLYLSAKAQAYAFQHTLTDLTDKAATLFFKSIQEANKPIAHQEAQPPQKAKVLECQPRIAMEDGEAKLSFKIGHRDSKLIIVRNLSDVYNAYQKNRDYELSKKESVHFATEDFTDESIPIFSLLMRRVREIRDVNEKLNAKSYYSAPSLTANYQQKLEGSVLDQFYDLADGMSCEYTDKSNNISSTITVGYRKMQFTLTLKIGLGGADRVKKAPATVPLF